MLPSTCIVVPTYWTRVGGLSRPGDAVYDHPTALGTKGTLEALLDSLHKLRGPDFYLLVLVAVTADDAADGAERQVAATLRQYPGMKHLVFGPSHLRWLHRWCDGNGLPDAPTFLDLRDYPKIRNLQLAIPLALGSDAIVALDDDEILTDPDFLRKAVEYLGMEMDGRRIDGLSGHYEQEDGSILLKVPPDKTSSGNVFGRKASIMNAATTMIESEPGLIVRTPFCFGGNMEFTRELAANVGFDPGITRGEDIDYLMNARMEGRDFFLRKDLRIVHCPPSGGSYKDTTAAKLAQDVIRFLYERAKVEMSQREPAVQPLTVQEFMPYPGAFLEPGVEEDARSALENAGYEGDSDQFLRSVYERLPGQLEGYRKFRARWPRAMQQLGAAGPVRDYLAGIAVEA